MAQPPRPAPPPTQPPPAGESEEPMSPPPAVLHRIRHRRRRNRRGRARSHINSRSHRQENNPKNSRRDFYLTHKQHFRCSFCNPDRPRRNASRRAIQNRNRRRMRGAARKRLRQNHHRRRDPRPLHHRPKVPHRRRHSLPRCLFRKSPARPQSPPSTFSDKKPQQNHPLIFPPQLLKPAHPVPPYFLPHLPRLFTGNLAGHHGRLPLMFFSARPAGSHRVRGTISRHLEQPPAQKISPHSPRPLPEQKKHRLRHVLGQFSITHHPHRGRIHPIRMPRHQIP